MEPETVSAITIGISILALSSSGITVGISILAVSLSAVVFIMEVFIHTKDKRDREAVGNFWYLVKHMHNHKDELMGEFDKNVDEILIITDNYRKFKFRYSKERKGYVINIGTYHTHMTKILIPHPTLLPAGWNICMYGAPPFANDIPTLTKFGTECAAHLWNNP